MSDKSVPLGAYTVAQFCAAHGDLSRTLFYELKKAGEGPRTFKAGRKTLISVEAAIEWRKTREAAESQPANPSSSAVYP